MAEQSDRQQGFHEGLELGTRVEHRVAVEAIANSLLTVLGKDAGDGAIDLGAAGVWMVGPSGRWCVLEGTATWARQS